MAELWCKTSSAPGSWESLQTLLGGYVGNEMPLLPLSFLSTFFFFFLRATYRGRIRPHEKSSFPRVLCAVGSAPGAHTKQGKPSHSRNQLSKPSSCEHSAVNDEPEHKVEALGQAGSTCLLHSTRGLVQSCRT